MAIGDKKLLYGSSVNLSVTALNSLASSSTWTGGAELPVVDNSSLGWEEFLLSGLIAVGNGVVASQIRIYVITPIDDTPTWPDVFDGTASGETITDAELRDSFAKLVHIIEVDADAGTDDVYPFAGVPIAPFFGGRAPPLWLPFVTHNTGANFASSGHQFTYWPIRSNIQLTA